MEDGMTVIGDLSRVLAREGIRPLVEAGAALATLADPGRDAVDIASDFGDIAEQMKQIQMDFDSALDAANEICITDPRLDAKCAAIDSAARASAARKAKRALVGIVALIGELDNSLAEPSR